MIRIRSGRGLGDALYLRPVAEHFVRLGGQVRVCCDYGDVFEDSGAYVEPFVRSGVTHVAHYVAGKGNLNTTQWQDVCASAGVGEIPLSFRWRIRNQALVDEIRGLANGRPIVMVNGGRHPMGRVDGFANEMLPARAAFASVLGALRDCYVVEVGKGEKLYSLPFDLNLCNKTMVAELLDIASIANGLVGQCSFMIPMAEAFDKPLVAVWAARGLESRELFIRRCTPSKILSKPSSRFVMDNWSHEAITETMHGFRAVL